MNPANRVVPAILTDNPMALVAMVRQAETFADWVQLDVMDGLFVPSRSVGVDDIRRAGIKTAWEAHLMVKDPRKEISRFADAGAIRIIVHCEAITADVDAVIDSINNLGIKAGLAVNPETPIESLNKQLLSKLDVVLFMAVHPGYYGAQFIPNVLDKIRAFRKLHRDVVIGIDGGIKSDNITVVASAGVNEICVGSAIFKSSNPKSAYSELLKLAQTGWDNQAGD